MELYKIRYWVDRKAKKGSSQRVREGEEVIVGNLDTAKYKYAKALSDCKEAALYSGFSGACELFVPHLFDNGEIAYWPDNEVYIERFEF